MIFSQEKTNTYVHPYPYILAVPSMQKNKNENTEHHGTFITFKSQLY